MNNRLLAQCKGKAVFLGIWWNGDHYFPTLTLAFKLLIFFLPSPRGMSLWLPCLVSTLRKKLLSGSSYTPFYSSGRQHAITKESSHTRLLLATYKYFHKPLYWDRKKASTWVQQGKMTRKNGLVDWFIKLRPNKINTAFLPACTVSKIYFHHCVKIYFHHTCLSGVMNNDFWNEITKNFCLAVH